MPGSCTPDRTRLLAHLEQYGPSDSVEEPAAALHRNYASLSRDIGYLTGTGLVEVEKIGRRKRIQATGLPILLV